MRILKKYGNRRLYDTHDARYVNLEDVARLVRAGEDVRVEDARTGQDRTRDILLQVVLEVAGGLDFLPTGLLRRVIRATGDDPAQRLLRQQLGAAFSMLHDQLDRLEAQFSGWRSPADAVREPEQGYRTDPRSQREGGRPRTAQAAEPSPRGADPAESEDLVALRARLASLEARLRR